MASRSIAFPCGVRTIALNINEAVQLKRDQSITNKQTKTNAGRKKKRWKRWYYRVSAMSVTQCSDQGFKNGWRRPRKECLKALCFLEFVGGYHRLIIRVRVVWVKENIYTQCTETFHSRNSWCCSNPVEWCCKILSARSARTGFWGEERLEME